MRSDIRPGGTFPDYALPDPEADLGDGLVGIVHDLSVPTLIAASRRGLYPLAHVAPLKWYAWIWIIRK